MTNLSISFMPVAGMRAGRGHRSEHKRDEGSAIRRGANERRIGRKSGDWQNFFANSFGLPTITPDKHWDI